MDTICLIPSSIGELWDKYTILLIKQKNINDENKIKHVLNEIECLKPLLEKYKLNDELFNHLKSVNEKLWIIEDKLRIKEYEQKFDNEFIELARSVYYVNDNRADIKKQINILFNSNIVEVKSYQKYN